MLYVNEIDQVIEQAAEQQEDWYAGIDFWSLDCQESDEDLPMLDTMFD